MSEKDSLVFRGVVLECYPDSKFLVQTTDNLKIMAYLGGQLKKRRIRVLEGDQVIVEVSPYDLKTGRIVNFAKSKDPLNKQSDK
jgi:translation initiation factor IF-1